MKRSLSVDKLLFEENGAYHCVKYDKKLKALAKELDQIEKEFIKKAEPYPKLLEAYEKVCQKSIEFSGEETAHYFKEGFLLGIKLGLEINLKN